MSQLTPQELEQWKSQIEISNREKMGLRKHRLAFTEQCAAMRSSFLLNDRLTEPKHSLSLIQYFHFKLNIKDEPNNERHRNS